MLGCGLMSEHSHQPAEKNWRKPQKLHFPIKASVVSKDVADAKLAPNCWGAINELILL